jgi:hypothetical protein
VILFQKAENITHLKVYTKFDMRNGSVRMTQGFFYECDQVMMNSVTFNKENVNSFHRAVSSVIVTAQCFGLFPVLGITGPNAASLR